MSNPNVHEAFEKWYFHANETDKGKAQRRADQDYKRCWESWDKGARWSVAEVQKLVKAMK